MRSKIRPKIRFKIRGKRAGKRRAVAEPPASTPPEELHRLRSNLENLPQEIYDMVVTFTFSSPANSVIRVEPHSYRGSREVVDHSRFNLKTVSRSTRLALNLMQVSSRTRALYCSSYYNNTTFLVHNPNLCLTWIYSMPSSHKEMLGKVVCIKFKKERRSDSGRISSLSRVCSYFGMSALNLEFVAAVSFASTHSPLLS